MGPCALRITYSAHTDLSVKFQSHRSRYSCFFLQALTVRVFVLLIVLRVGCIFPFSVVHVLCMHFFLVCYLFFILHPYPLLQPLFSPFCSHFYYYIFCWFRDYTNPYLPVAPSAIDGSGQVRLWELTPPLLYRLLLGGTQTILLAFLVMGKGVEQSTDSWFSHKSSMLNITIYSMLIPLDVLKEFSCTVA